jgi:hypothetical protein
MRIVSLLRPAITLALVVASACQTRPTPTPAPQPDPPAASLFILTDVPVGAARTTTGSTLRGVTIEAFNAAMR